MSATRRSTATVGRPATTTELTIIPPAARGGL
jgi:hypothetical protein